MAKIGKNSSEKVIQIDLTNIITDPDLDGKRTRLDGINKVIGNLFFNQGSIPVHDKGKELYYNGNTSVSLQELQEMVFIVAKNPISSAHYHNAVNNYFQNKLKENG
ncbi:hypothetical protein D9M68_601890 [compost metagenome]